MAALPWASRSLNGSDTLTIVGGLAAIAALYVAIDQLLGEISPKSLRMSGRAL
jgi:preprotein translocase subunit SecE